MINHDTPVAEIGIKIPKWVDSDITLGQIEGINYGGCESGSYMPAVTYYQAMMTMGEHGDDVIRYIERAHGTIPSMNGCSWHGMAVKLLSTAVEAWAASIAREVDNALGDE